MLRSYLVLLCAAVTLFAQQSKIVPPSPPDYGQWEQFISYGPFNTVSPDGKWLTYGINRANGNNELRVINLSTGATVKTVPFGEDSAFSEDSHFLAYSIGLSESQTEKLRKDKNPVQKKLGLLNLPSAQETIIPAIESFAFSPNGLFLAMRQYAPEKKGSPATPSSIVEDEPPPTGATLVVRQLSNARDFTFGNVSAFAWQYWRKQGHLLAMIINTASTDQTGNSVQLFDATAGTLRVLDSASASYSGLAWRKDSNDLAFLCSKTDDKHQGATNVVIAVTHLTELSEATRRYDPTTANPQFPSGLRIASSRTPTWSDDAHTVFLGVNSWRDKPPTKEKEKDHAKEKDDDEPAAVSVWHWRDPEVMPHQKLSARRNSDRTMLAAWNLDSGAFTQLGHSLLDESVSPLPHQSLAWAADWKQYALERSIGRPAADIYLIDVATGTRTKVHDRLIEDRQLEVSPNGRYLLYLQDNQYWTVNTVTHAVVSITSKIKTSFVDRETDFTAQIKPPFGVAGWTKDDAAVILYDKFDLWKVAPDGSQAVRITDGAEHEIRHRYIRLDPEEEFIDLNKPLYLSLFGIWSKQSGYARIDPGATQDIHLIYADQNISRLSKASNANVLSFTTESFEKPPELMLAASSDWKEATLVASTNEFQSKYAWGHSELIEYKNASGERLQGALYYPAGFEAGHKYPMVVYMYEKLSDSLHRYSPLSERIYYGASAFTSHGYFLLLPDIRFRPREPGVSVADCVTAAVKKALQNTAIDEHKVGIIGHSWGGFDSAYLATHTHIFAAAIAGAPITDLVSNYGNHHWSSGIAETDHIETGQQRMQVPLWEDLPAYIRNSAIFTVQNMTTPLMIEVGDSDGTVFFHQGVELYNIARRARKEVVMLEYQGEDHGLRKKADQIDYQRRIFVWFGHYLKGEPAPSWITNGETYLDREREVAAQQQPSTTK